METNTKSALPGRHRFIRSIGGAVASIVLLAVFSTTGRPAVASEPSAGMFVASDTAAHGTAGLPLPLRGPIHETSRSNAETYVVAADSAVYHDYLVNGQWVGWSSLGGPTSGIAGDVAWGTNYLNNQELYVKGNDGQIYHLYATPGQGSGWRGWDPMGTPPPGIRGDVHEGTNNLGNQELYVIGNDARVWHNFSTPGIGSGWSAWGSLGGPDGVVGDVAVASGLGSNQVLTVSAGERAYQSTASPGVGSGWGQWAPVGSSTAAPTVNPMLEMVNDERAAAGIGPVAENVILDSAAVAHSVDQAAHQAMSHSGSDGSQLVQRITGAGYTWGTCGENVAAGQPDTASVMAAWMNSPGHRANILNPNFVDIGFGQTRGANGAIYWTMDLGAPR